MLGHPYVLLAAMAITVIISSGPALAQYLNQGSQPYLRYYPSPPAADDNGLAAASPGGRQRDDLSPSDQPALTPFFAMPDERQPTLGYESPPRPPASINPSMHQPGQAPGPAIASTPRPEPFSLASLPSEDQPEQGASRELAPQFKRQLVNYQTREPAGTIIIDTPNTYLYLVLGDGKALRYGIGVGREGFAWAGAERVSRMAEWPDWNPPAEMIERQPYLPRFMAGGEGNPLGARALYLGKTLYRIHGTNQPSTIGTFVSSGCIRLTNADIEDLYGRVQVGARVVVLQGGRPPATATK